MRRRVIILILTIFATVAAAAAVAQEGTEAKKQLYFFLPVKSTAVFKQIEDMWSKVGEKIGKPIEVMTTKDLPFEKPTLRQTLDWLKTLDEDHQIDISVVTVMTMFRLEEEGMAFMPLATFQIDKKKYDRSCLFVRKDSPYLQIKEPADRLAAMKGKTIGYGHSAKSNPVGEMLLFDYDIIQSAEEYFNIPGWFGSVEGRMEELMAGDIEAFIALKIDMKFATNKDKGFQKEIVPLVCSDEYTNMPMILRSDMDRGTMYKLRDIMLNIHKDRDFPQLQFIFYAINGHFVPVKPEDYVKYRRIYDFGRKEGWIDDIGEVTYLDKNRKNKD